MPTASTPSRSAPSREIEPKTAEAWVRAGEAILIDVRDPDESARERIEGALLVPLSRFDPAAIPAGKKVVLHCRTGRRSAEALARLTPGAQAFHIRGGIEAWKAAGLPVQGNPRAPIPIMRQVQITAGALAFIGSALGAFVSPWFLLLSGFIGAGLVFSGVTGTCGMAATLSLMPWNRALKPSGPAC